MAVSSIEFTVAVLGLAAIFPFLPGKFVRQATLCACNLVFFWLVVPDQLSWIALAGFLVSGYVAGIALATRPSRLGFATYLTALVVAFVWLKKYAALEILLPEFLFRHPIGIVGLSYMFFRQIHFVTDAMQGQISDRSLWAYLNYQLNLFTLLSGPIQRYQQFSSYWASPREVPMATQEILLAIVRVFWGIIKLSLVGTICLDLFDTVAGSLDQASSGILIFSNETTLVYFFAMLYLYPAFVYFNFSGYCDVVIGAGRLFGMDIPENFDRPYISRNMIDFWNREHRSLSIWIRDYLFTPMYKAIAQRSPQRAPSLAFACYFIALFLAGVWHGATLNFVIFGILHGIGVSVTKLWENAIVKRRGRKGLRVYLASMPIRVAAIFVAVNFACVTFLFFPADLDRTMRILRLIGSLFV